MRSVRTALLLCLAIASGAPGARAGEAERDREKAFKSALAAFFEPYSSERAADRRGAVESLSGFADDGAARFLISRVLPREENAGVLFAAVAVIAEARRPDVIEWIVGRAKKRGDARVRGLVVDALADIGDDTAKAAIRDLLESARDPRLLPVVLAAAARTGLTDAVPVMLGLLEHDAWNVRAAAIEALTALRDERAVDPFVDRLEVEEGRLRQDLVDALHALTGKDLGPDADLWRAWLKAFRANGGKIARPPDKKDARTSVAGTPTYFGIPIVSKRVLFVMDVSLSMRTPLDAEQLVTSGAVDEDLKGRRATDPEGEGFEFWNIKNRLDFAKAHFVRAIERLHASQRFGIVRFSTTVRAWLKGRLVPAIASTKAKAADYIGNLEVEGETATGAVLRYAFEEIEDPELDTIYLLTDGAPSDLSTEEILEEVRLRNRERKIRIHVVAMTEHSVPFLRQLASESGGQYRFYKMGRGE